MCFRCLKMKYIVNICLSLVFILNGCSTYAEDRKQSLVLPYSAFGPPTMSGTLIGVEWFQWLPHGESRPREYDINVIIYREIPLKDVKNLYPISQKKSVDYRYISYSDAVSYFDHNITEVIRMKKEGYPMGSLSEELKSVKIQIINELGD